uniref:Adenylate cyclase-stimulating G alpha protein n=2 Tax=Macrostomum lignano TaxID=282301 RepID=A0A1I8IUH1_9PLAT
PVVLPVSMSTACCPAADTEAAAAARINKEIEKQVRADFKLSQKVIQLLLLGTGESGKSTVRKQMQIIHINGFSNKERLELLPYMRRNIRDSIATWPKTPPRHHQVVSQLQQLAQGQQAAADVQAEGSAHGFGYWETRTLNRFSNRVLMWMKKQAPRLFLYSFCAPVSWSWNSGLAWLGLQYVPCSSELNSLSSISILERHALVVERVGNRIDGRAPIVEIGIVRVYERPGKHVGPPVVEIIVFLFRQVHLETNFVVRVEKCRYTSLELALRQRRVEVRELEWNLLCLISLVDGDVDELLNETPGAPAAENQKHKEQDGPHDLKCDRPGANSSADSRSQECWLAQLGMLLSHPVKPRPPKCPQCIVAGMQKLALDFDTPDNQRLGRWLLELMSENQTSNSLPADRDPFDYSLEFFAAVETLWRDSGVQLSYQNSSSYQLIDCAKYFLDRVRQFSDPGYTPSDQDILRCRVMTSDISDINFDIKDGGHTVKFRVFDVGGQRGERRKWIQCFNNVTAILYLCDVSSFDLILKEDDDSPMPKNRLLESLDTFQEVWLNRYLQDVSILLFINKIDQLEEKVRAGRSPQALINHCLEAEAAAAAAAAGCLVDHDGCGVVMEPDMRKKSCVGPINLRRFICSFSLEAFQPPGQFPETSRLIREQRNGSGSGATTQKSDRRDFITAFPRLELESSPAAEESAVHPETVRFACYVQRIFQEIASRKRRSEYKFEYHYHACYSYFTCAVNTDNVKKVLEGCRRFIIDKHLERFGI